MGEALKELLVWIFGLLVGGLAVTIVLVVLYNFWCIKHF